MSQAQLQPDPAEPAPPSLDRLRLLAAGVCKNLMRARLTRDPAAFSEDVLGAWNVGRADLPWSEHEYLRSAADTLEWLLDEFAWEHHTTSLGDPVDDTPAEVVVRGCVWLVPREGEERPDVGLRALAMDAREGRAGEWWLRFHWDELDDIREALNLLPLEGEPDVPRVQWADADGELRLDGQVILTLTWKGVNLRKVLNQFQQAGWPKRTPLGNRLTTELQEAVKSLNDKQTRLRFSGDGTGDGVCWEERATD